MLNWKSFEHGPGCMAELRGMPVGIISTRDFDVPELKWSALNGRHGDCDSIEDGKRALHVAILEWFSEVGEAFDDWSLHPGK